MISIVFSTFNGAKTLPMMFDSLQQQNIDPTVDWEIIVVNNNSTDNTQDIIDSYKSRLPINSVFESKKGKNAALNTGIKHLKKNEFVIFTDDDIVADKNWLSSYVQLMKDLPDFDVFGGLIKPLWLKKPSEQILSEIPILVAFAVTIGGEHKQGEIDPCSLFGPNMAVRRKVLQTLSFNEDIGPSGTNYVMGSETDFLHRAKCAGFKAFFCDQTIVQHIIRPNQLDIKWLENRAYKAGRALVHDNMRNNIPRVAKTVASYPRWLILKLIRLRVSYYVNKIRGMTKGSYANAWNLYFHLGYGYEYRLQSLKKGQKTNR